MFIAPILLRRIFMNIVLYNNKSENNKVDKELTQSVTLTGNVKNETSIVNPTFLVEGNPIGKNYAYISDFERYYFIKDVKVIRSNLFEIDMTCDVLMTYKSSIRSMFAIVERNQYRINKYLPDTEIKYSTDYDVITKKIGNVSLNNNYYIIGLNAGICQPVT